MKRRILTLISMFLWTTGAAAQPMCPLDGNPIEPKTIADLSEFRKMAVMEDGRIKPVESYARNFLLRLSGRTTYDSKPATEWFVRFMFAPQNTVEDKIFMINHEAIPTGLGLELEKKRRYSFAQLRDSMDRLAEMASAAVRLDQKERDVAENEIIRLFENLQLYSSLSLTFAFTFPHSDFTLESPQIRQQLELPAGQNQFSFLDISLRAELLRDQVLPLERIPESEWSNQQKELVKVISRLFQWSVAYQNLPFAIVPSYQQEHEWKSPWDAMSSALRDPVGREEMDFLRDMVVGYWNGEQVVFDLAVKNYNASVKKRVDAQAKSEIERIPLENFYHDLNPFFYSMIGYLIVFLLFLLSFMIGHRFLYRLAIALLFGSFALHGAGLIIRIILLQRPPVSNLYETFVFVGFVSVLVGLMIEHLQRNWIGAVVSAISGYAFLVIASKFQMEGDTLEMLVAVLNSNFWLGTHVLSITIGYAGVVVAGIIGHIYLIQSIWRSKDQKLLKQTQGILIGAMGFGLTMTFLGTNLGGIWADQSWGRFWGWDPKENGALLIILWLAIVFHAKIGRLIGPIGFAAASAASIIVVMWAWFGVNLLSIGLHSYGFTSGLAANLAIYLVIQIVVLAVLTPWAKRKSSLS